jgi:hypothetical protein
MALDDPASVNPDSRALGGVGRAGALSYEAP